MKIIDTGTNIEIGTLRSSHITYIPQYAVVQDWHLEDHRNSIDEIPEDTLENAIKRAESNIANSSRETQYIVKVLKVVSLASRETVTVDFINNEEESTDES